MASWRALAEPIDLLLSACQHSSRLVLVAVLYSPHDVSIARGHHSPALQSRTVATNAG